LSTHASSQPITNIKCCYAEISALIADQGSCMSRFCPSYAAYSVTVSNRIVLPFCN